MLLIGTRGRASLHAAKRDALVLFPREVDEWRGTLSLLDQRVENIQVANDYLVADYARLNGGMQVNRFVA